MGDRYKFNPFSGKFDNVGSSASGDGGIAQGITGNTAGTAQVVTGGTVYLAGGNNVTMSQENNTITISAGAGGTQSFGMSNLGNTAGTSGIATGPSVQYLFAGGNNVTLSQSINGASGTVTISAFNQTVESQSFGISNLGNTSGTSGIASGGQIKYLFAGGNNVTLSQSVDGASGTVTISAGAGAAPVINYWDNALMSWVSQAPSWRTFQLHPLVLPGNVFPGDITVNTAGVWFYGTGTVTAAQSGTVRLGFYTNNAGTLSMVNSASASWGWTANAGNTSNFKGVRFVSFGTAQWSSSPVFRAGSQYWLGQIADTVGSTNGILWIGNALFGLGENSGMMGAAVYTSGGFPLWFGASRTTIASNEALPSSIGQTQIVITSPNDRIIPWLMFNNITAF